MLSPSQFHVNEVWIFFRVNDQLLYVKKEPYDMYVLMDAASTYVFGHVISLVVDETPQQKDVEDLFKKAWEAKSQWPEKLIVTEDSIAGKTFIKQAEKNGLSTEIVPLSDLETIVSPIKESFVSDFIGKST